MIFLKWQGRSVWSGIIEKILYPWMFRTQKSNPFWDTSQCVYSPYSLGLCKLIIFVWDDAEQNSYWREEFAAWLSPSSTQTLDRISAIIFSRIFHSPVAGFFFCHVHITNIIVFQTWSHMRNSFMSAQVFSTLHLFSTIYVCRRSLTCRDRIVVSWIHTMSTTSY